MRVQNQKSAKSHYVRAENPEVGRISQYRKEYLSALARQLTSQALIEDGTYCHV